MQYLLGCADAEFGSKMKKINKKEDGERRVIVTDCDQTSHSAAIHVCVHDISHFSILLDAFETSEHQTKWLNRINNCEDLN